MRALRLSFLLFLIGIISAHGQNNTWAMKKDIGTKKVTDQKEQNKIEDDEVPSSYNNDAIANINKQLANFEKNQQKNIKFDGSKIDQMAAQILENYRSISQIDLEKALKEQAQGSPVGPYLENKPKFFTFLASLLKDERALPQFFSIIKDRRRLLIFFGINIALILVGYIWRRREQNLYAHETFVERFPRRMMRFTFMKVVQISFFIYYFYGELAPLGDIFNRTFL